MSGGTDAAVEGSVLSLPKGGGALSGIGEKFAADPFSGTGRFTVPLVVPPGRRGVTPHLSLEYSSGNGNGPFGLGWQLALPRVSRKTSRGLPRYLDSGDESGDRADVFVLSGGEDLVPVVGAGASRTRYRPRTEGLFARIEHVRTDAGECWEVRGRDGLLSRYGTRRPADADTSWRDPAVLADPLDTNRIFSWCISETSDSVGNLIRYEYLRDVGTAEPHRWDQPLIRRISYGNYGDTETPSFLIWVDFDYEARPDPFSDRRAGFEVRTSQRCRAVRVTTHASDGVTRAAREYGMVYEEAPFNGVSLLARLEVVGIDDTAVSEGQQPARESLPPLTFEYSSFAPTTRRFQAVTGFGLPAAGLGDPTVALVDVRGSGLPDLIEMGAARRVWFNAGNCRFERPRELAEGPPVSLRDPGVQFLDTDGDGRPDLLVPSPASARRSVGAVAGYYRMKFGGGWSGRSFRPYRHAPSVSMTDPAVKWLDLDGDGLTDLLRSGTRLECWFNDADPRTAWQRTTQAIVAGPTPDLADPRVRMADMTGDGLQDIVLLNNGNIAYWPNLGHGRWGARISMRRSPRLPEGFNPRHVLLGDLDGDGAADLVFVDRGRILVWGNQTGNAWSEEPVVITGTPVVTDADSVQISDLRGNGVPGLVFSRASVDPGRPPMRFLDLTGGVKPYLLQLMDNHLGATTLVQYRPSTAEFLRDQGAPDTRWRTTLPIPVQVVSRVEIRDAISGGRLTTRYRYRHGYWDGIEREFRGFAMVEHIDAEDFGPAADGHFSAPVLTRSWFHPGPVAAAEAGDWVELDLGAEYWGGDPSLLSRSSAQEAFLAGLSRDARRDALRAMRGQVLRTELYALDGTVREPKPYEVTESLSGVRQEPTTAGEGGDSVFFPFLVATRSTQWERGDEPMTRFTFHAGYDSYGFPTAQVDVAVPRGRDPRVPIDGPTEPYLATYARTEYAQRDDDSSYVVDRVCRTGSYEVVNDGRSSAVGLRDQVLADAGEAGVSLRPVEHACTYYDGDAFAGLPLGQLGAYGLVVRTETLAASAEFFGDLYRADDPAAITDLPAYLKETGEAATPAAYPQEFLTLLSPLAGYAFYADQELPGSPAGYYVRTARHQYDVHDPTRVPRGLPVVSLDPLGARTVVEYDSHDLLPARITDAAGLVTEASNDYRVLRPATLTDVNGNATSITFSPAGLVTAERVRGKDGEGDRDAPSTHLSYDLLAFADRGDPASVLTTRRVHHDTEVGVPAGRLDDVIVTVEYSDGFGRQVQTRRQAEDTLFGDPAFGGGLLPVDQLAQVGETAGRRRGTTDPDNVVVSGRQVYDNKGRVVLAYEPCYATGFAYAEPSDAQTGQATATFYDPRGHAIRVVAPDGSEHRVVFGTPVDLGDPDTYSPTPWESYLYDANDNGGRTHPAESADYAAHWNTPSSTELDALGRTVKTVSRNGDPDHAETRWFTTGYRYDIRGNLLEITDALGRPAYRYSPDLLGRVWRTDSIDAGRRDTVLDALGGAVEVRDSKGALTLTGYDGLHRSIRTWARDDENSPLTLRRRIEYGDGGDPGQPGADRAAGRAHNLLGRVARQYDEAGVLAFDVVDFRDNPVETTRRVIADGPILATYEAAQAANWQVSPFRVEWTPRLDQTQAQRDAELLEPTGYVTSTEYDALARVSLHTFPTDVEGARRQLRPTYDRAGALAQLTLDDALIVQAVGYDARGQRTLVAYGNGVMSRYGYDPRTLRLTRLRSEPYILEGEVTYRAAGAVLQDCAYDYDLAGNLLAVHDRAPRSGVPNNPDALGTADPRLRALLGSGDALDRWFAYDPLYRLVTATGREFRGPGPGFPWNDDPRGTDVTQTQPYRERYRYDSVGGMLQLAHASEDGFTRDFTTMESSNRLRRMTIASADYDYANDASGNVTAETSSRHFTWTHSNQLSSFANQAAGAEPSLHAHYLYDLAGQRVKKLVRRQGGLVEVTHYVDETFEHQRWSEGQNNVLHMMDDHQRVALVRVGTAHPDDQGPGVAFQLADHLGSSIAVLDGGGSVTNREEYTPFGETSFGSHTRKRYRFTGMERDAETGMTYHSSRYLLPWLARWACPDPLGGEAGVNAFSYVGDNPERHVDPTGTDGESPWNPVKEPKPKVKVWGGSLAGQDVRDSAGREAGQVSLGKAAIKINPKDLGVEATISAVDVDLHPRVAGPVDLLVSGTALKAKVGVSKKGIEGEVSLFDAGVGGRVGPVKAKVLFGLSLGAAVKGGKVKVKGAAIIGFEFELDVGKMYNWVRGGSVHADPPPDFQLESHEETGIRTSSVAYETVPPLPSTRVKRISHHRYAPLPAPAVHGCQYGPDSPDPRGRAYVGASPLR